MKRIYRATDNKVIAGICAGIGEMFSIDPNIVRLAAVFVCVATGIVPLVVAYAVGWVIIPEKTSEEIKKENQENKENAE